MWNEFCITRLLLLRSVSSVILAARLFYLRGGMGSMVETLKWARKKLVSADRDEVLSVSKLEVRAELLLLM
jgi:hypothetical protein